MVRSSSKMLKCCLANYHASCQFFILLLLLELTVSRDVRLVLYIPTTFPLALGARLLL